MGNDQASERLAEDLQRTLEKLSVNVDRVEILTAAIAGFRRPVPDYEPKFHHGYGPSLRDHTLASPGK
jgi:hypothetical protein